MKQLARYLELLALITVISGCPTENTPLTASFTWTTVANNGDYIPTAVCDPTAEPVSSSCRNYNSYNQPSVNMNRLVVFRARSRGGQSQGEPVHGVYMRDMAASGPIIKILDRNTLVPPPNNLDTLFQEPPSFPRIDIWSNTIATRGNHQPVWSVTSSTGETVERAGTTGIYTLLNGQFVTGTSKLGGISDFSFFEVPEQPGTLFDVFPGAPAVTDGNMLVFKGNYTVGTVGKTGVYYREISNTPIPLASGSSLSPAAGNLPVVLIANNTDTFIPGTDTVFGSTAPPSAANGMAVFSGFDNEDNPSLGGIYLAPLTGSQPPLTTLVSIGELVPGEGDTDRFNKLGEGLSFDGRFVAFWGAWGTDNKPLILQCPTEGNKQRIAYCNSQYPDGFSTQVPIHQGIFVYDIQSGQLFVVAKTPDDFDDFLYWNFSGHVPGSTEGDDGEPARWRSSAFAAVSGVVSGNQIGAVFRTAFKARSGQVASGAYVAPVDGIYLGRGPVNSRILTLIATGMPGNKIDPKAKDADTGAVLPVTVMGLERDGFRGSSLVINVTMGSEETGWSGIYMTEIQK